jgi:hypothetical protein
MSRAAVLLLLLALVPFAKAQQLPPEFGTGTHALRGIIKQKFNLQPLNQREFDFIRDANAERVLLVALGETGGLERFGRGELIRFVRNGGAVLLASDQETHGRLASDLGLKIAGDCLVVPPGSRSAYRGLAECPIIRDFTEPEHPIFRTITAVATNRPGHLVRTSRSGLRVIAWFPDTARGEGAVNAAPATPYPFAAAGAVAAGKVLVLADHSVFINDMMLQPDTQNFAFAWNCIDWLTDSGKRAMVFFLEDGRVVTDFNITLKDKPPLPFPIPSEEQLIEKGNEVLASLDEGDVINRLINERLPHQLLLQLLAVVLTGMALFYAFWRLSRNRHKLERHEPLLAACVAGQQLHRPLLDQRNEAMLRQNNYWEAAHQMARQWFATLLGPRGSIAEHGRTPPLVPVRGGWWQRRALRRQIARLWRLAVGSLPEKITAAQLRRVEDELQTLRAAVADGILQLTSGSERGTKTA